MKKVLLWINMFCLGIAGYSQNDLIRIGETQNLIQSVENQLEINDEKIPYEILEELQELRKNPLNVNKASNESLRKLPFLSDEQISNIYTYREKYGDIMSYAEMLSIPGFSIQIIKSIMPYTYLFSFVKKTPIKKKKMYSTLFLRYSRSIYKSDKYTHTDTENNISPSSFLGSPNKYLIKLKQEIRQTINWGLVAEKDPGEIFFLNKLPDTIKNNIPDENRYGFDFYSGFLEYNGKKIIDRWILGDYQITSGQGLNIWTSGYFGITANPVQSIRYGRGIKPNTSTYECGFMRGSAVSIKYKRLSGFIFYSNRNQDATLYRNNEVTFFTSLRESGYHRSINELRSKNTVKIKQFGGGLDFLLNKGIIGINAIATGFSNTYDKKNNKEFIFAYKVKNFINTAFHYKYTLINKITLFGEIALQNLKSPSLITGAYISPLSYLDISLVYKYFNKRYFNISANPGNKGNFIPENNLQLCLGLDVQRNTDITLSYELIKFNWIRPRVHCPGIIAQWSTNINYTINKNNILLLSYNNKEYQNNITDNTHIKPVFMIKKDSWQLCLVSEINESIRSKSKITINKIRSQASSGSAFSQEFTFLIKRIKTNISLSMIIFSTDDYNSRIYVYEKNVLHAFSFPCYSGNGAGAYLLIKTDIYRKLSLWLRLSRKKYFRNSSSSDSWQSNKGEISIQLRVKL